jgi:SET domain-containing protein
MKDQNSALGPDFEIKDSSIDGQGLFALREFAAGEVVIRWDISHRISAEEARLLPDSEKKYLEPHPDGTIIIVQPPARYVNHSCDNNTEVRDFCDVAVRRIKVGEEITSNYSNSETGVNFKCHCGSANCRGRV